MKIQVCSNHEPGVINGATSRGQSMFNICLYDYKSTSARVV